MTIVRPREEPQPEPRSTIVIVGAGPRGTGVLERLAASAPELHPDGLDVHLVDPYPPVPAGSGGTRSRRCSR